MDELLFDEFLFDEFHFMSSYCISRNPITFDEFHFMSSYSISRNPITFDGFHFTSSYSISRNPITFDGFHFMSSFFFLVPSYDMIAFVAVKRGQVPNPPTVGWECLHDPTDVQIESVRTRRTRRAWC